MTTGLLIPLYIYPGAAWNEVAELQRANPHVPMVAVVNPDSGPGIRIDSNYTAAISNLQSAGVTVLGYVPTAYASPRISAVESMMRDYKNWYLVNGIFFDEMSTANGNERYYTTLNEYSKLLRFTCTVGNPGSDIPPTYIGTLDTMVIYENCGLPSTSLMAGWHSGFAKSNFAILAHGVPSVSQSYLSALYPCVAYLYATNEAMPNPYGALPPYLASVASALQSIAVEKQIIPPAMTIVS